jgi:hypothetical protein
MSGNWAALEDAVYQALTAVDERLLYLATLSQGTKRNRELIATARMLGFTFQQIADLTEYANKGTIYDILNGRFDR